MALVGVSVVVFFSTNIDDLFLLLGFFADPRFRGSRVVIGQFIGIGALVVGSLVASLIALVLAPAYVGLLGLLPIAIGARSLFARRDEDDGPPTRPPRAAALGQIASVAATTIANGGDNLGVYVPWFAIQTTEQIVVVVLVFAVMTGLWLAIGHWLVHHPALGAPIRRYAHRAMPFVLIALGIAILYESGSIALFAA